MKKIMFLLVVCLTFFSLDCFAAMKAYKDSNQNGVFYIVRQTAGGNSHAIIMEFVKVAYKDGSENYQIRTSAFGNLRHFDDVAEIVTDSEKLKINKAIIRNPYALYMYGNDVWSQAIFDIPREHMEKLLASKTLSLQFYADEGNARNPMVLGDKDVEFIKSLVSLKYEDYKEVRGK